MHHAKWMLLAICFCSPLVGCGDDSSTSLVPQNEDQEYIEAQEKKAAMEESPTQGSI
ncbi:hypothetical protein [Allorhodopirellula solitaria]|uniref:Uncharacterized protein n=1 Tax=Allorhodopirellula solitaria TaxID=2527987 RepID=A0A5C5XUJ5_9BACT|nr:hypothetical protein [Allorhodopirellula solitaria]TWT66063.1 hypothetical protein CA85_29250 [Allorhodopirellula solitaria]